MVDHGLGPGTDHRRRTTDEGRACRMEPENALVSGETIEQTRSAGGHQVLLTAAVRHVHRIPRGVWATEPVVMAHHGIARSIARPVVARGHIGPADERAPV